MKRIVTLIFDNGSPKTPAIRKNVRLSPGEKIRPSLWRQCTRADRALESVEGHPVVAALYTEEERELALNRGAALLSCTKKRGIIYHKVMWR